MRKLPYLVFAVLGFGAVAFASCGDSSETSPSAFLDTPISETRIAFHSNRDGDDQIYVMNWDGSEQTRLTNNSAKDVFPTWSPDGRELAFVSIRDGNSEIYVMGTNGNRQRRLTDHPGVDTRPTWSPDGSRIAFYSDRDGNPEIYTMDAAGGNVTRLTDDPSDDAFPAWGR